MQKRGIGYKKIAEVTQLPVNAVKSYITRHSQRKENVCLNCGKAIVARGISKEKRFCSKTCKSRWWYAHPHMMTRSNMHDFVCPICGKRFRDYGKRIYCSVACYAAARRKSYD